jgi:hypothetical protein
VDESDRGNFSASAANLHSLLVQFVSARGLSTREEERKMLGKREDG